MFNATKAFVWAFVIRYNPNGLLASASTQAPTQSLVPSVAPTTEPSSWPSLSHSEMPSSTPSWQTPTTLPSASGVPTTKTTTTTLPSSEPSLNMDSGSGITVSPSETPSALPSASSAPSTELPSGEPSDSFTPSGVPSSSLRPSSSSSGIPSVSTVPSDMPSSRPSDVPSASTIPSSAPSLSPSVMPSLSSMPSSAPSESSEPSFSSAPSAMPSLAPTEGPEDRFNYGMSVDNDYGPADWQNVECKHHSTCPGWPDDWETFNPYIPYDGAENSCMDCSTKTKGPCRRHKQSPLDLYRNVTAKLECKDRHWMHHSRGTCGFGRMRFAIERHGLRAYQPIDEQGQSTCREPANIDYSMGFPDRWHLVYTDIKVPSEHMQDGKRYDAEIQLASRYSKNREHRLLGTVSVFLEGVEGAKKNAQLEMYINRWRREEQDIVNKCASRRLGAFVDPTTLEEYTDFDLQDDDLALEDDFDLDDDDFIDEDDEEWDDAEWEGDFDGEDAQRRLNRRFNAYQWLRNVETEYYFRYEGSQGVPPCLEVVHWRVMKEPINVPLSQINWLDTLTKRRIDPDSCLLDTAGRPRADGSGMVDVNRPVQLTTHKHKLVFCECIDWESKKPQDQAWCNLTMEERGVMPHWSKVDPSP